MRVSPFGDPRIDGYVLLPVAFRSLSRPSSAPGAKASALCSLCLTSDKALTLPACIALHALGLLFFCNLYKSDRSVASQLSRSSAVRNPCYRTTCSHRLSSEFSRSPLRKRNSCSFILRYLYDLVLDFGQRKNYLFRFS